MAGLRVRGDLAAAVNGVAAAGADDDVAAGLNDQLASSIKVEPWDTQERRRRRLKADPGLADEAMGGGGGGRRGQEDEFVEDEEQHQALLAMGLPTQFSFGREGGSSSSSSGGGGGMTIKEEKNRKGEKKQTYYCEVCELELNSYDTMTSHMKGVKHTKKTLQEEEKRAAAQRDGTYIPQKLVRQVQAAKSQPKKIPVRLAEKLREDNEPLVGLAFVEEVLACSNAEMEPHYECHLCGNTGGSNGMRAHVLGRPHRVKFMHRLHPNDPVFVDPSKGELIRAIERLRENGDLSRINTVYSDLRYPWPAGKAPWSIDLGGTGCPPPAADFNLVRTARKAAILSGVSVEDLTLNLAKGAAGDEPLIVGGSFGNNQKPGSGLPAEEDLLPVSGQRQMNEYLSLSAALLSRAAEFLAPNTSDAGQRERVKAAAAVAEASLAALRNVQLRPSGSFGRFGRDSPSPSSSSSRYLSSSGYSRGPHHSRVKEEPRDHHHRERSRSRPSTSSASVRSRVDTPSPEHNSSGGGGGRRRDGDLDGDDHRDGHSHNGGGDRRHYVKREERSRSRSPRERHYRSRHSSSSSSSHYNDRRY